MHFFLHIKTSPSLYITLHFTLMMGFCLKYQYLLLYPVLWPLKTNQYMCLTLLYTTVYSTNSIKEIAMTNGMAVIFLDKRFMPLQNKLSHDEDGQSLTDNSCRTPGISPIIPISAPSKVPSPGSQGSPSAVAMSSLNSFYVTPSGLLDSHYSPGYQCPSPSQMNMSLRNRVSNLVVLGFLLQVFNSGKAVVHDSKFWDLMKR